MKAKFEFDDDFRLQYEDPDFDGQLTYLMDIEELPHKVTMHLLVEGGDTSSTADTEILSEVSSRERLSRWPPDVFPVPTFALEVDLKLREGNAAFERNGKHHQLSRGQKHHILVKVATAV